MNRPSLERLMNDLWKQHRLDLDKRILFCKNKEKSNHKYKNSERSSDISVEYKSKDEIIEILYKRLKESNSALKQIKGMVNSSFGTKDITDYNGEILNPLYENFKDAK